MREVENNNIKICIDTSELENTIEKANKLKELLQEVREIICSLAGSIK